ncbi:MAG: ABC transporter permease subunit [Proteobacteria bacterium]|jgi:ABC-2 type transport system permease protein|nr:ABC transporter permease subunit [Pseudomonadota bacterium]
MRNIVLIARRELGAYVCLPMGYVIVALVLFVDGLLFNAYALGGEAKLSAEVLQLFFAFASFMTMVSGVLLAMRLVAEEHQLGTLTLLLTAPVRDGEIVLGKFLSALTFFALMTLLSLYLPLLVFVNGKVALGQIVGGYLGLLLLGSLSLSIGLFASALARSQIVAAVTGGALLTACYLLYLGAGLVEPPLRELMAYLSPQRHLQWQTGLISSRDVFYYLSGSGLFLVLTTHVLQARRWR